MLDGNDLSCANGVQYLERRFGLVRQTFHEACKFTDTKIDDETEIEKPML